MNQSTGLTERQNQSLPEKQMRSLTVNQAQRLNEEQIQSLSDEQLCSLSNEQIQSLTGGPVKIACERLAAIAHTGLKQQSYPQSVKEAVMMEKKASGQSYYPEALYAMKKLAMADNGNQTAKLCLARMLLHGIKENQSRHANGSGAPDRDSSQHGHNVRRRKSRVGTPPCKMLLAW